MRRVIRFAAVAAALAGAPAVAHAQAGTQQLDELIVEIQQIQRQIQPLHQQALQDPGLRAQQLEATGALQEAMVRRDPEVLDKLARMGAILEEASAAQKANDEAKLAQLAAELQSLEPAVSAVQRDAMADPAVSGRIAAFQQNLFAKMIELDPQAEPALTRLGELEERIRSAQAGLRQD